MKKFIVLTATMLLITMTGIAQNEKVELKISGMTCTGCSNKIHTALTERDGIVKNEINYPGNWAVIEYNPDKITLDEIILSVKDAGFEASLIQPKNKKEMSHCKAACPKPCCSSPNFETGKCSCAAKGKDCSVQCCAYKPDKK